MMTNFNLYQHSLHTFSLLDRQALKHWKLLHVSAVSKILDFWGRLVTAIRAALSAWHFVRA